MEPTAPTTAEEPRSVRRLTRSREGRWLGGVCSGLGRYFGLSPWIYRLAFVALALAGGTGVLLYLAALVVIPGEGNETSVAEDALRDHRDRPGLAIGVGLLGLGAILFFSNAEFWPHPGNIWLAALLLGGGLVWWELHGQQRVAAAGPTATTAAAGAPSESVTSVLPAPRRPSLLPPVLGVLFAAAGVLGLLETFDAVSVDWRIAIGCTVAVVGGAIVVGSLTQRRVAGLVGLELLLLPLLVLAVAIDVPVRGGIGDRTEQPAVVAAIPQHYRLAVGDLEVDLRDLAVPVGETHVQASVGIGQVLVDVPEGVAIDVTGRSRAGEVSLFGSRESGFRVERHHQDGSGARRLVLDLEVGLGDVEVRR